MVITCKFCNSDMFLEDREFCCDECGATYSAVMDYWTDPVVPKCEVSTPKRIMSDKVIEMGLCEIEHTLFRPGILYRFVVMPDCEKCKALDVYKDEKASDIFTDENGFSSLM